jgi:succinate dehydrogenase / fumarate reductase, flavoprotein subunit
VAELQELARDVDVRPSSEGYADLAHALDLRASLVAAEATLLGALARRESRGAHQRRDFPQLDPDLRVNFRTRLEGTSHLTVTAQPVPPVPPELASWTQSDEVLDVAGRLLE